MFTTVVTSTFIILDLMPSCFVLFMAISEFPKGPPPRHALVFKPEDTVLYGTEFSRNLLRNIKVPNS